MPATIRPEPEFLRWALCDVYGRTITPLFNRSGGKVTIDGTGLRTCEVTIPTDDEAINYLVALRTLIKVWKRDRCVFVGHLQTPRFQGRSQTVSLSAANVVNRLERRYLRDAFAGFNNQGPVIQSVLASVETTASEQAAGIPLLGITYGAMDPGPVRGVNWDKGANVWACLNEIVGIADGPDLNFEPLDGDDGILAALEIVDRKGSDRSGQVVFEFNCLRHNCFDMEYVPDGAVVRNRYTTQGSAVEGAAPPYDTANAEVHQSGIGLYEGFETIQDASANTLEGRSKQMVSAYGEPPPFFTVTPANEALDEELGTPPLVLEDYDIGDTVGAVGQYGAVKVQTTGRVDTITFNEVDAKANLRTELSCVPTVIGEGVV